MSRMIQQTTPAFPELGDVDSWDEGDEIVFTHGLFDAHSHGRDNNEALGDGMTDILGYSRRQFGQVLLMPNLAGKDALMTPQMAVEYFTRAQMAAYEFASPSNVLDLLVTVYLNPNLTEDDIEHIAHDPRIAGVKSYPAHATTNSEHGLRTPLEAAKQLAWMEKYGVPLLVHGQVRTKEDGTVMDEFDREPYFYQEVAPELDRRHPELRISYEHLSTGIGAQAVVDRKGPTLGTFTQLHLAYTRTDVMDTGVRTDMTMKPMVQHARELPKLWEALKACPKRFALGSDDAWHPITAKHAKNVACGGCYGPHRVGGYLSAFEAVGALGLFGGFACENAARFYGVEIQEKSIRMKKGWYDVPATLPYGKHEAEPLHAGERRCGWYQVG